jgi:hypothetical protein
VTKLWTDRTDMSICNYMPSRRNIASNRWRVLSKQYHLPLSEVLDHRRHLWSRLGLPSQLSGSYISPPHVVSCLKFNRTEIRIHVWVWFHANLSKIMSNATRNDFAAFMEPTGLHRHVLLPRHNWSLQVTSRIKELGWNKTLPREL